MTQMPAVFLVRVDARLQTDTKLSYPDDFFIAKGQFGDLALLERGERLLLRISHDEDGRRVALTTLARPS
jgi:hypothetical protein